MKRIRIEKEKCMGCFNCVLGCMTEHNEKGKSIFDLVLTDISNEGRNHLSLDYNQKATPILCRHCDEPECVTACMSGAMTKNSETGMVLYDRDKCSSCFMCVMSCPYGVLKPDQKRKEDVVKCDMCEGKEIPACVEMCPTGSLFMEGGKTV